MEIILKQDVAKLGNAGDVVKVKNGYASNYLIPQGYATLATVLALKQHNENRKQQVFKEAKVKTAAEEMAQRLNGVSLTIAAKVSASGKIYGSVNALQIAEALKAKGFGIERKLITVDHEQIKEVGKYIAEIKLHREINVRVEFDVVSADASPESAAPPIE
jgi:large subunit ribosomal protein L9